jgi:hypothetical protein
LERARPLDGDPGGAAADDPERHALNREHIDQGAARRRVRQGGAQTQAIGRSRGGRTTRIHAITDSIGRLFSFRLTPGNVADVTAGVWSKSQLSDRAGRAIPAGLRKQ